MPSQSTLRDRSDDDAATQDMCRIMASWSLAASSNKAQAHQFRLQSSFALIGFGAVSSTIFIDNGSLFSGVFVLIAMIVVSVLSNNYYFKDEYAWDAACSKIDTSSSKTAMIGLRTYILHGGEIQTPDDIYGYHRNEKSKISRFDFTTTILFAVGLIVGVSISILVVNEYLENAS